MKNRLVFLVGLISFFVLSVHFLKPDFIYAKDGGKSVSNMCVKESNSGSGSESNHINSTSSTQGSKDKETQKQEVKSGAKNSYSSQNLDNNNTDKSGKGDAVKAASASTVVVNRGDVIINPEKDDSPKPDLTTQNNSGSLTQKEGTPKESAVNQQIKSEEPKPKPEPAPVSGVKNIIIEPTEMVKIHENRGENQPKSKENVNESASKSPINAIQKASIPNVTFFKNIELPQELVDNPVLKQFYAPVTLSKEANFILVNSSLILLLTGLVFLKTNYIERLIQKLKYPKLSLPNIYQAKA